MSLQQEVNMYTVPSGVFRRGSSDSPDERPTGEIELSAFLIDESPVTNRVFAAFIENG